MFGDSYTDTGENVNPPYGMTWPGIPGQGGNRSCDGRNEVDYFGMCPLLEIYLLFIEISAYYNQ